jgi:hypothetical protein
MNVQVARPSISWMVFQDTFRYRSNPKTNTKLLSFVRGVHSLIENMPFGLKNAGATFQRAMSFSFHDLKHIVEAYLDDLASRSHKRADHSAHIQLIFEQCLYYWILLNPKKCSFCVTLGCFLGFIVLTTGIMVDPLKVEVIVQFPSPCTIPQLQSLKGIFFLRRFITNYADITKGFMCLLKKDIPFHWDEAA